AADPALQLTAYNTLQQFTSDFVIDSDTFRGKSVGISGNIRSSLVDALEDKNKNQTGTETVGGYSVGTEASQNVRDTLLNDLLLVQDEKVGIAFSGTTDNRKDSGAKRELGTIINKYKEKPVEAMIDTMLIQNSDAVRYKDPDESLDDFIANKEAEKQMLVSVYKKSIAPGATRSDKERYEELINKSRYVDRSFIDNIAESGANAANPLDWSNSLMTGLGKIASMAQNTQGVVAGGIAKATGSETMKELSEASYKNARRYDLKGQEFDKKTERGGVFNDEDLNPYDINLIEHIVEGQGIGLNNIGDLLQTGSKGVVQGAPEIAVSGTPLGATLFTMGKAADIAVEQNGGKATVLDAVKTLPNAVAYTMMNKVEGSLLTNKLIPKGNKFFAAAQNAVKSPIAKKILAVPLTAGKVLGSAGIEGGAESVQSLAENVKPGESVTKKDLIQARNEGIAGMGGGTAISGAQVVAENGGKVMMDQIAKDADFQAIKKAFKSDKKTADARRAYNNSDEVKTQTVDFDSAVSEIAKEDEVLTQTVLFANEYKSGMDKLEQKMNDKIDRWDAAIETGKDPKTGRPLKQETLDAMVQERDAEIKKLNEFESNTQLALEKKIAKDINTKYKHLTTDELAQSIDRRKKIIDEIAGIKNPTDKQRFLAASLKYEIKNIKELKGTDAKVEPVAEKSKPTPKPTAAPETLSTPAPKAAPKQAETFEPVAKEVEKETPVEKPAPVKGVSLDPKMYKNLSAADKAWMEKFDQDRKDFKKVYKNTEKKRNRLVLEMQKKKSKPDSQATKARDAATYGIGQTEADKEQQQANVFKKSTDDPTSEYKNMDQDTLDELDRMHEENAQNERQSKEENTKTTEAISETERTEVSSTAQADAGQTMEEAAGDKEPTYNFNSIEQQKDPEAVNIYSETDMYDVFNDKDTFVQYLMEEYSMDFTDASAQFDIAREVYLPFEAEVQNIKVAKPFGEMAHPADELALGKVSSKLVFDKTLIQSIFAAGYPALQVQSQELSTLSKEDIIKRYGAGNEAKIEEIRSAGAGSTRLAKTIGKAVMKDLGLGKGLSVKDSDALAGDIGLIFITTADRLGMIDKNVVELVG
ncbi:MAG: hypothetical protein DRQ47_07850, partial [Gammaproteobacteria bacterium]